MGYNLIALRDEANIIGYDNNLIYKIPEDLKFFKSITSESQSNKKNAVVMGYNTWNSIPNKFKPLENRLNVVISQNHTQELIDQYRELVSQKDILIIRNNFEATLSELENRDDIDKIFIIGGCQIYSQAIKLNNINKIYLTDVLRNSFDDYINQNPNLLVYFPYINYDNYYHVKSEVKNVNFISYVFNIYISKQKPHLALTNFEKSLESTFHFDNNIEEQQYLDLLKLVIEKGVIRQGRNGVTYSTFGQKMEFNLANNTLPILTTKRMAIKTCIKELLWFITGNTNNQILNDQGVHIWDGNSTRQFLDQQGFRDRSEGDLGPIYGFQWRHCGAKYQDCQSDYSGLGIDQLKQSIDLIMKDPYSRRNIVTAWNPVDIPLMALPPCHIFFQWYVENDSLSLQMYQRSGDSFLGIPFNIMSYSLLVHMVAHLTDLKPGRFIHIIGDFHAYEQHLDAIKQQIQRKPKNFPTVNIKRKVNNIDDFKLEDFEIIGYESESNIKAPMIA